MNSKSKEEQWAISTFKAMKFAIKEFGSNLYHDKGPEEVMFLDSIEEELRKFSIVEVGRALKIFRSMYKTEDQKYTLDKLFSAIMIRLQDWNEFFDNVVEGDTDLEDY